MVNKRQRDGSLSMQWQKPLATPCHVCMEIACAWINSWTKLKMKRERRRFLLMFVFRTNSWKKHVPDNKRYSDNIWFCVVRIINIILLKLYYFQFAFYRRRYDMTQGIVIRRFGVPKWVQFFSKCDTFNNKKFREIFCFASV